MRDPIGKFYAYMDTPIAYSVRFALVVCCVPLLLSWDKPLWRISMEAPQYPNGLWMEIYPHRLAGGNEDQHLAEINTLNHYIGMAPIHAEDFAELGWIPFVVGALAILCLRVAAIGNVRSLLDLAVMTFYALGFLMARFVYRMYVFGHELDPKAPFTVEPFTPAIFGTKQIANFTTHSFPRLGTYLIGGFAIGIALATLYELWIGWRNAARRRSLPPPAAVP